MIARRFVTALLATLPLGTAHAAIFCPANETELRQALATAATNNEDDDICDICSSSTHCRKSFVTRSI